MSAVDRVLEHVEGVQEKGNGFWALCPAHDDHNPSLHIQQSDDGSALIICRAGCDQGDVVDALERRGLKRSDLFASKQVASVVPLDGRSNASRSPSKGRERLVKNITSKTKPGGCAAFTSAGRTPRRRTQRASSGSCRTVDTARAT